MIQMNEHISFIPASMEPLSADVAIIRGQKKTYIFDVGASEEAFLEISGIDGPKAVIISHFHPDHMGNLRRILEQDSSISLYVGSNTYKYTKKGTIVEKDLVLEDDVTIHIFPIPSSHAKGSLGIEVDGRWVFIGDALCTTVKQGAEGYNQQILSEEIHTLERLDAEDVIASHNMPQTHSREDIISLLNEIYELREKNSPFICYNFRKLCELLGK